MKATARLYREGGMEKFHNPQLSGPVQERNQRRLKLKLIHGYISLYCIRHKSFMYLLLLAVLTQRGGFWNLLFNRDPWRAYYCIIFRSSGVLLSRSSCLLL